MRKSNANGPLVAGLGLGVLGGYALIQQLWVFWQLTKRNVEHTLANQQNKATRGLAFSKVTETAAYTRIHTIEDGIERIVYRPKRRRFETPIVMQHGMWHGAWCWAWWQELFAEWGWETHAHSLPGHAGSPVQRPHAFCTLDYYLSFLKAEIERLPTLPILMGHSMGGALVQWYLKYVRRDLPATVLVAPWVSHSMIKDGLWKLFTFDPIGFFLMMLSGDAVPMKRMARGSAVRFLLGPQGVMPLKELQRKLSPESAIVMYQHNPPFWYPPEGMQTPMLWIAGEDDWLLVVEAERRSAAHYGADFIVVPRARHNVMMEHNYRETAEQVHQWLIKCGCLTATSAS